jgi:hypothetical protein
VAAGNALNSWIQRRKIAETKAHFQQQEAGQGSAGQI